MHLSHLVETIDTHTAGNPTRNLIAGVPRIEGKPCRTRWPMPRSIWTGCAPPS